jgi:hypothetical protein
VCGSPAGAAPSHIRLTDCADGGGLGGPAWDYYRGRRCCRDRLVGSSVAGGQGVAGSNPVVPTARARPGELESSQLTGPLSCPDVILSMIYTASRLGPTWDPRRCSDRRAAASVTDCRSGCKYRCVVVSDPCPAILRAGRARGRRRRPSRSGPCAASRGAAGVRSRELSPLRPSEWRLAARLL